MVLYWRRYGRAGGCQINGGLAQLGEHLPCKQGVESSNLLVSTKAMRSGFHGTEDECACTNESCRDRKVRANARDEVSFAYESHDDMLLANQINLLFVP